MRRYLTQISMVALAMAVVCPTTVHGEADGPDFWAVKGVKSGDVLNIRAEPSPTAKKVGTIPHDGRGLRNLGCQGLPTFAEWSKMNEAERQDAQAKKWCQIEFQGIRGWVAGRFLGEG